VWTAKRFLNMQRHVKVAKEKSKEKNSNMKCWITAGVLAFVSVCAFIGVTLWLGLSVESEDNIKSNNFNLEEIPSSVRNEKQQVVLGTANQKIGEDYQRRNEQQGSDSKHMRRKQHDEFDVVATTELTEGRDKDVGEEAYVQEVHESETTSEKENIPTGTTAVHNKQSLTSGSPLYPQPIPETPTFTPEDPTVTGEIATPEAVPIAVTNSKQNGSERAPTPATLPFSSTGMTTEKESDIRVMQQMISKPEHDTGESLDNFFQNPAEENRPVSLEADIGSVSTGQGNKYIRRFDISDVVNERGEHFMPQNFEYPHDRDHMASQHFDNPYVMASLIREHEHEHEIVEDGIDREDVPSLDHDDGLFYTPSSPDRYDGEDPDSAENPFTTFLQGRLQELYNWLSTDEDLTGKYNSDSNDNSSLSGDFMKVLVALNRSLNEGNSSILLGQLKDMYYSESKLNITDPALLHNSSSIVSFGLLAFDLLLLRNVQQIAWEEEKVSSEEMMKDPEVLALNALFMPPEKVRELQVCLSLQTYNNTVVRYLTLFATDLSANLSLVLLDGLHCSSLIYQLICH